MSTSSTKAILEHCRRCFYAQTIRGVATCTADKEPAPIELRISSRNCPIGNFTSETLPAPALAAAEPKLPALMGLRLDVCQTCPHLAGVTLTRLSVLCAKQRKRCSCPNGEVPLAAGRCPDDPPRWR